MKCLFSFYLSLQFCISLLQFHSSTILNKEKETHTKHPVVSFGFVPFSSKSSMKMNLKQWQQVKGGNVNESKKKKKNKMFCITRNGKQKPSAKHIYK